MNLANLDAKDRMLYPPTMKPRELGFVKMGGIMVKPTHQDDTRNADKSGNVAGESTVVSLGIDGGEVTSGGYLGTFVNGTSVTVERLTLVIGCVENGNIVDSDFFVSDLLKLEPGGKETFQFRGAVCDEIDHTIVPAVAAAR